MNTFNTFTNPALCSIYKIFTPGACHSYTALTDADIYSEEFKEFVDELERLDYRTGSFGNQIEFRRCHFEDPSSDTIAYVIKFMYMFNLPRVDVSVAFIDCVVSQPCSLLLFKDADIKYIQIIVNLGSPTSPVLDLLSSIGNGRIKVLILNFKYALSTDDLDTICRLLRCCYITHIYNDSSTEIQVVEDQLVEMRKTIGVKESLHPYEEISSTFSKSAMKTSIKYNQT